MIEMAGKPQELQRESRSTRLAVAVTGAFLTDFSVERPLNEYQSRRDEICRELTSRAKDGWSSGPSASGGTYSSGGGFSDALPLVVCQRAGEDLLDTAQGELRSLTSGDDDWNSLLTEGWSIELRGARIDVYDFGVAVLSLNADVTAPATLALKDVASVVKRLVWLRPDGRTGRLPSLSALASHLAQNTVRQLSTALSAIAERSPMSSAFPLASDLELPGSDRSELGRLLWLHPVTQLSVPGTAPLEGPAEELAAAFHETIAVENALFVPGVGSSAVVSRGERNGTAAVLALVERHWAIFAFYMAMDRKLLLMLDSLRWRTPQRLSSLETEAQRVFECYGGVLHVRARIDSELASLGGDEQAIWNKIASVQNLESLVGGVDRKISLLQSIAERRVQEATIGSNRRTTRILSSLTALTIVTVTVGVLGTLLGSHPASYDDLLVRASAIIAAMLLASIVLIVAFRYRPRQLRGARRSRSAR